MSTHDTPPFGEDTDDAVSAFIDRELDGFASDRGLTPAHARAELEAWSGFAARREELEQARSVLGAVPPLDDVARRRVLRAASPEAGRSRWSRLLVPAAAAVALVAVVAVGIGIAVSNDTETTATQAPSTTADEFLGDVGDVSDPVALRAVLELVASDTGSAPSTADATDGAESADDTGALAEGPDSATGSSGAVRGVDPVPARRCAEVLAGSQDVAGPAVAVGDATYQGATAVVVAFREGERTLVFVADPESCEILTFQSR